MKCPFCGQELKNINFMWFCENESCRAYDWTMEESAWQELIRTRKALKIAVDELTKIKVDAESVGIGFFMTAAIFALAKIKTALEQKDK